MRSGAPDTARSSRISRQRSSSRKSKTPSVIKEDVAVELVKTKWREVVEEEGCCDSVDIVRAVEDTYSPSFEVTQSKILKIKFGDGELALDPIDIQVEGCVEERQTLASVCSLVSHYSSVTVLRLVDCKLRSESVLLLASCLVEVCQWVRRLYLDLNPISGENFSPLLSVPTLEVLSLRGCEIGALGARLISDRLLDQTCPLKLINLNTNLLDDQAASYLATALKWNARLLVLSAAGNSIGSNGAKSLVSALRDFPLQSYDLEQRRERLIKIANLIVNIVNERKQAFLSELPPMPPLPSGEFTLNRKTKRNESAKPARKHKLSSVRTASTSFMSRKSAVSKKIRTNETSFGMSRSGTSIKPAKVSTSSTTAFSDTAQYQDAETEAADFSDDDSVQDFSRFEGATAEDWDRKDNERRYKQKMLKRLYRQVAEELDLDKPSSDPALSRVVQSDAAAAGSVKSAGNSTLTHLNLAQNRIGDDAAESIIQMLDYQRNMNEDATPKRGLRLIVLKGNPMSRSRLSQIEAYFSCPPTF